MAPPPKQQGPPSMMEGLQGILGDLGAMMAAPDADINFLTQLQHAIVMQIKKGTQQAMQQHQQGMQQAMGGGGQPQRIQPGGGAGMSGFNAAGQMQQAGPGMNGPGGMPNPDEARRILGGGQAA